MSRRFITISRKPSRAQEEIVELKKALRSIRETAREMCETLDDLSAGIEKQETKR